MLTLAYAACTVPVAPIRAEANHRSEQVTQALYGERLEVLKHNDQGWLYVRCNWDDYEGWVVEGQLSLLNPKDFKKPLRAYSSGKNDEIGTEDGSLTLSPGSDLFLMRKKEMHWTYPKGIFKGRKINLKDIVANEYTVRHWSKLFLGSPYQWGGRNIMGMDCSGFTQVTFKLLGISLQRDAWQQAEQGELINFLQEAACGDLAFFDNEEGRITHVGILLDAHTIIHATETSGCVIIDPIDNGGIVSKKLRTRTHNLRLIKRYF